MILELERSIVHADRERIYERLALIRPYEPMLIDAIEHLIDNFAYQNILELLQQAKELFISGTFE